MEFVLGVYRTELDAIVITENNILNPIHADEVSKCLVDFELLESLFR